MSAYPPHHRLSQYFSALLLSRNALVLIITTLGMLPYLLTIGGYYPFADCFTQLLPFIVETKRMLESGAPWWSWNTYFGDNFIASYSYYTLTSPFALLNCLFPYRYIAVGFTLMVYLRLLVCAWITDIYLRRMGFCRDLCLVGSLLFTFSSWAVCSLSYVFFIEPMIAFVLLLIAIERFLAQSRYCAATLVLASGVVALINYYFMPGTLMAAAVYYFCRLSSAKLIHPWRLTLKAVGCVAVGIMMAAVVIVPAMLFLSGNERISQSIAFNLPNILERIRTLFMPKCLEGPIPLYFFDTGYYSNAVTIPVFGILLAALLVVRRTRYWISVLTLIFVVAYVTPINDVFMLFTSATYTRWAFALSMAIVLASLTYLNDHRHQCLPRRDLWIYTFVCSVVYLTTVGLIFFLKIIGHSPFDREWYTLMIMTILFVVNLVSLWWTNRYGILSHQWTLSVIVSVTLCSATAIAGYCFFRSDDGFMALNTKKYSPSEVLAQYNPDKSFSSRTAFLNAGNWLNVETNNALLFNTPSVSGFNSLMSARTRKLMLSTNDLGYQVKYWPERHRESMFALMGVDTVVTSTLPGQECIKPDMAHLSATDDSRVYRFDMALPLGFAYDTYIPEQQVCSLINDSAIVDVPLILLNALALDDKGEKALSPYLRRLSLSNDCQEFVGLDSIVGIRKRHVISSFDANTHGYSASITIPDTMVVFFSVGADKGFACTIDDKPSEFFDANLGLTAVLVPAGTHNLRFEYHTPGLLIGAAISLTALLILLLICLKTRRHP